MINTFDGNGSERKKNYQKTACRVYERTTHASGVDDKQIADTLASYGFSQNGAAAVYTVYHVRVRAVEFASEIFDGNRINYFNELNQEA